ncbi:restriction endonuclease subunit S [Stenotrophomonas acidaminiphila]|uniref:methylation-associated defense system restriction endonuclease subunit S MAD5 n=1 Tax=Stenotrophomonas acidaminiphila TaxID=128780 RepID=UPI001375B3CA|nr:restriction endonuclease subunit S [Stenotrophomonas acidaminiphila]NCT87289.1 restriction endonuclease subunit S [Stenotrophomonas acidaminiphila]
MKAKSVPSSWLERDGRRLDCNPYMSGALEAKVLLESMPARKDRLQDVTRNGMSGIFHAGRIKRMWVDSPEHGQPFLSSTEILQADLSNLPLISRKAIAENPRLPLHTGWTLITRSGTVGRMAYARPDMEGYACSEHVLRVVPDAEKIPPGYLYAYLSSKFGVPLVIGGTFGSIIQHIEPEHIANLPVPRLGTKAERDVHALMESAASNRSRAHELRQEAQSSLYRQFSLSDLADADTAVNYAAFNVQASSLRRLDAAHHSPACRAAANELASAGETKRLDDVARVFTPGIFKRIHVEDPAYGYPYFSGTELFQYDPEPRGYLSRRAPKIDEYIVRENWLLIQDAGQLEGLIGRLMRVTPAFANSVVSNHLMRVAAEEAADAAYLSVVLSSPHGYRAITRNAFGSSIPQLDPAHIGALRLPWPKETIRKRIAGPVLEAWNLEDEASANVRKATKKVEDAIEKGATN